MKYTYNNYLRVFEELESDDKRTYILENLDEIIKLLYRINIDYNKDTDILKQDDYETDDEYLMEVFKKIISLKGMCASNVEIILDNLYEEVNIE